MVSIGYNYKNGLCRRFRIEIKSGNFYAKKSLHRRPRGLTSYKLQDLIDNPIKREELQKKAVERIKRYYSWEDVTDKYERLFKQVINKS